GACNSSRGAAQSARRLLPAVRGTPRCPAFPSACSFCLPFLSAPTRSTTCCATSRRRRRRAPARSRRGWRGRSSSGTGRTSCRVLEQGRRVAEKLKKLGVEVSVADHLGFLRQWYVLGPFDAQGWKGFKTGYPPEKKVDLQATYEGKDGKKLAWKRFDVKETLT